MNVLLQPVDVLLEISDLSREFLQLFLVSPSARGFLDFRRGRRASAQFIEYVDFAQNFESVCDDPGRHVDPDFAFSARGRGMVAHKNGIAVLKRNGRSLLSCDKK